MTLEGYARAYSADLSAFSLQGAWDRRDRVQVSLRDEILRTIPDFDRGTILTARLITDDRERVLDRLWERDEERVAGLRSDRNWYIAFSLMWGICFVFEAATKFRPARC